jgi:hypothetical protein
MAKAVSVEERKIRKYKNFIDANTVGHVHSFMYVNM